MRRPSVLPTAAASGLLVAVAAVLVLRPLACQLPARAVGAYWMVALLTVGLPGVALVWAAGLYRRDVALLAGQGLTLGFALHGLFLLAGRVLGIAADVAFPLLALGAAATLKRFRGAPPAGVNRVAAGPGVLAAMLAGCIIQPLTSARLLDVPAPVDLAYHAGNAAELRHRWPMEDPRVAGLALNYPVLSYALPVTASRALGLPAADTLHGLSPLFWIALLALQVHNAARVLLGDRAGASLATFVVLLHQDLGRLLGLGPEAFSSFLATGIFGSPTTVCGLILFAALVITVLEVTAAPHRIRAVWPLLVVFGAAASLTKATVVPVLFCGSLLVALRAHRAGRRDTARAALLCALLLAAAALPFTVRLGTGDTSYRGILRWDPGAIVRQFVLAAGARTSPWVHTALAAPVWLLGYFGFAALGALVFLLRRRGPLEDGHVLALGTLAAGAVPALLLDGHGLSQLFFLYNGQLLLAALAGGGVVRAWRARSWPVLLVLGVAALPPVAAAAKVGLARPGLDRATAAHAPPPDVTDYATGLAWLRANAAADSVVFADNPSLLLSAFGECRMYYETGLYAARGWERRWEGTTEPFPERAAFQDALLRRPSPQTVAEALRLFPHPTRVLVVADSVQSTVEGGILRVAIGPVPARALLPPRWFRPLFANRVMHVYLLERP